MVTIMGSARERRQATRARRQQRCVLATRRASSLSRHRAHYQHEANATDDEAIDSHVCCAEATLDGQWSVSAIVQHAMGDYHDHGCDCAVDHDGHPRHDGHLHHDDHHDDHHHHHHHEDSCVRSGQSRDRDNIPRGGEEDDRLACARWRAPL